MAYMEWRSTLEVGHEQIDCEHRSLVDTLNQLHAAMKMGRGKAELEKVLTFLKDYTVGHFQAEEAMMGKHGYPGSQVHLAAHADMARHVSTLVADYQSGKTLLTGAVFDFLETWLVRHIMSEDRALGDFLQGRG